MSYFFLIYLPYFSFIVGVIAAILFMFRIEKSYSSNEIKSELLTQKEQILTALLCFITPVVAGMIFYYGWRKKMPKKAKQANKISWIIFGFWVAIYLVLDYSGILSLK